MSAFNIVPFDRERHSAFVFDTFRQSAGTQWPWDDVNRGHGGALDLFRRDFARSGFQTLVAELAGDPDVYLGWATVGPAPRESVNPEVLFAYTRHAYRREFHVCSTILESAGVELATSPTPIRFWTRASERIAEAKRWPLYWRVTSFA